MKNPEEKAREVLSAYWDGGGFPVDPVRLAQKMGIKVVEMTMPSNVSGAIFKAKGKDAVIAIEQSDSTNRKRFSCAHEIGHYVSRESCAAEEGVGEYEYVDFRGALASKGTDAEEKFANSFAAALLMPKDMWLLLMRCWAAIAPMRQGRNLLRQCAPSKFLRRPLRLLTSPSRPMTTEHPITPPPGLIKNWCASRIHEKQDVPLHVHVAIQAARWGADQELEACCEWMADETPTNYINALRAARRPKPPSLKEQALEQLDGIAVMFRMSHGGNLVCDTIRRALEQLDD